MLLKWIKGKKVSIVPCFFMNFKTATPACAASIFLELHTYKFEKRSSTSELSKTDCPCNLLFPTEIFNKTENEQNK